MKKVILSLAIAGVGLSGSCYGMNNKVFQNQPPAYEPFYSSVPQQHAAMNQLMPSSSEAGKNFVNLCEISPWECCSRYIRVNYPKFMKIVHNIKVATEFAVVGAAVGVLAYYNLQSFHNIISGIVSFPGHVFNGIVSHPIESAAGFIGLGSIGVGYATYAKLGYANNH